MNCGVTSVAEPNAAWTRWAEYSPTAGPPPSVEFDEPINRSQQVPLRHMPFERELVKQRILPDAAFPDHQTHSDPPDRIESAQLTAGNSLLLQRYRAN